MAKSKTYEGEIKSVSDFLECIKILKKEKGTEYFFRGHNERVASDQITPKIYRRISEESARKYVYYEDQMFSDIIRKRPHQFSNEKTILEKLVKMSHYFLPTRLLDITSNPLVALYFACKNILNNTDDRDGEVIVLKVPETEIITYDGDTASLISNLALMPYLFPLYRKKYPDLNNEIKKEHGMFELNDDGKEDLTKVFAVKVKENNERIAQQGRGFSYLWYGTKKVREWKLVKTR